MTDFDLQMRIWGYAILGQAAEKNAVIAETGDWFNGGWWDRTAADNATSVRDIGRGWEPVPDWYALPHLPFEWREAAFAAAFDG